MSFRDQSCVFINVVLLFVIAGMNLIQNIHCKERKLVGGSGGGEIISFIVLPPLRHTRWTGRPSRIEITQFFWKLFPVDFGFLKFLGNGDVFFCWKDCNQKIRVEHAFGRREESRKFQELEGFEAKCSLCAFYLKQWACFPFPDMQRGRPGEKENLVFCITWAWLKKTGQLKISMISSFSSSSSCWPVHLF